MAANSGLKRKSRSAEMAWRSFLMRVVLSLRQNCSTSFCHVGEIVHLYVCLLLRHVGFFLFFFFSMQERRISRVNRFAKKLSFYTRLCPRARSAQTYSHIYLRCKKALLANIADIFADSVAASCGDMPRGEGERERNASMKS